MQPDLFYVEFTDPDDDQTVVIGVLREIGHSAGKGKALVTSADPEGERMVVKVTKLTSASMGVLIDPDPLTMIRTPKPKKERR